MAVADVAVADAAVADAACADVACRLRGRPPRTERVAKRARDLKVEVFFSGMSSASGGPRGLLLVQSGDTV